MSEHIKGHQDEAALASSNKAQWNNTMDQAAKNYWQHIQTSPDPTIHSPLGEPWELWLEEENMSSTKVKCQLLDHTCGQVAQDYQSNQSHFWGMDTQSINWQAIQTVVTGMTINQCHWTTKFTTGFGAIGHMMYWWGKVHWWPACNATMK